VIDTGPIGTIDFDLRDIEKDFLVLVGRVAALQYLRRAGYLDESRVSELVRAKEEAERLRQQIIEERRRRRIFTRALYLGMIVAAGLVAYRLVF
jgi:hypothetical protein